MGKRKRIISTHKSGENKRRQLRNEEQTTDETPTDSPLLDNNTPASLNSPETSSETNSEILGESPLSANETEFVFSTMVGALSSDAESPVDLVSSMNNESVAFSSSITETTHSADESTNALNATGNTQLTVDQSSHDESSTATSQSIEIIDVDKLPDRPDSPIGDDVIEIILPRLQEGIQQATQHRRYVDLTDAVSPDDSAVVFPDAGTTGTTTDIPMLVAADTSTSSSYDADGQLDDSDLPKVLQLKKSMIASTPKKVEISCPICMDNVSQISTSNRQLVSTTCGHIFCNDCLNKSLEAKGYCPTCRKKLNRRGFHPLFI